jgi:Tfp pilus assembly protein PilF
MPWLVPAFALLLALMALVASRQLGLRFGAGPTSENALELARQYLEAGRHMEAMVVAKKGLKAHPRDCETRLLLAQIYAEQHKDDLAVEALEQLLQISPDHAAAKGLLEKLRAL